MMTRKIMRKITQTNLNKMNLKNNQREKRKSHLKDNLKNRKIVMKIVKMMTVKVNLMTMVKIQMNDLILVINI